MQLRYLSAALAASLSLTACDGSVNGHAKQVDGPTGRSTEIMIGFEIKFGGSSQRLTGTGIDVADLAVDIATHNAVVLDGWGTASLVLTQGGTEIATTTFDYVVMDAMAVAADPATVNGWLAGHPNADGFEVKLHDVQTEDVAEGTASLVASTIYGGDVVNSSSVHWPSSGGSGCPGGGIDDGINPEMPIIDPGDPGICP